MSRDWTKQELKAASTAMKVMGHMGYEEFCEGIKEESCMVKLIGENRKEMAQVISEMIGEQAVYRKVPSCAYQIGGFTISKESVLTWAEDADPEIIKGVIAGLQMVGFTTVKESQLPKKTATAKKKVQLETTTEEEAEEAQQNADTLTVEIPRKLLDDNALANLDKLIEGKGNLIKKAIGAESLEYTVTDNRVQFPWFTLTGDADEALAYTQLISKLAEQARTAKRVSMKEKAVENEKYAFRCFLLRLGFIGDEYKAARRVLLKKMSGNGAWKNGDGR